MNVQCLREREGGRENKVKLFVVLRLTFKYKDSNVLGCVITKTQVLRHFEQRVYREISFSHVSD